MRKVCGAEAETATAASSVAVPTAGDAAEHGGQGDTGERLAGQRTGTVDAGSPNSST